MGFLPEIFTIEGRINRLRYLKYQIILALIFAVIVFAITFTFGLLTGNEESILVTLPTKVLTIIGGIGNLMLSVRRLHDLNRSGWFILVTAVPFLNVIFILYLYLAPGTNGYNDYGADPLSNT